MLGNCGVGFAPVHPDQHDWLIELMEGVEDIPGSALSEGIRWGWQTFEEYLDVLDRTPKAINVGAQLPHAALRGYVMGSRALEAATAEDVAAMAALVTSALRAGALGVSTGRTMGHRDANGGEVPGTHADVAELAAVLHAMDQVGRGVLQVVPAGISAAIGGDAPGAMDDELEWMLRLGRSTDRPITFLVMDGPKHGHDWRRWFEAVRAANAAGANIRPQVGSRCFGMLFGLQSAMNPFRLRPSYRALSGLPLPERVAALRRPDVRERILGETPVESDRPSMDTYTEHLFGRLFPLGADLDYEPPPDRSIAALASATGRDPWEVLYDEMLVDDGRAFILHPMMNFGGGTYDGLFDMLSDPLTVQGLGDGGAHCSMVCDASMTTYLLSYWVRDRPRGGRLVLEEAVRRLTSDPAKLYGIAGRGVVAPGYRADLNVIDPGEIGLEPPELVTDLPGGSGRIVQRSRGYVATLVGGSPVVVNGEVTDARPGVLVRSE